MSTALLDATEAETLSIAEAAQVTGLSTHTLRYYERAGLMRDSVERAASSHRRYNAADIRWVQFVTKLRRTGMPIRLIVTYTELVRAGAGNEAERLELLVAHRTEVLDELAEVARNLEEIERKIGVYRGRARGAGAEGPSRSINR